MFFIQVTKYGRHEKCKALLNVEEIISVHSHPDGGSVIELSNGVWIVDESYDEIREKIEDCNTIKESV